MSFCKKIQSFAFSTLHVFCLTFSEGINFGKSGQKNPPEVDDNKLGTGRATLRLRSTGPATVEEEVRCISTFL